MASKPTCFKHFDPDAMREDLMDDPQIVGSVLKHFLRWQTDVTGEIRRAIEADNLEHMRRVGHSLRGTLAQLHATTGASLAAALELTCAQRNPIPAGLPTDLLAELEAIASEVSRYLETATPA